MEKQIKERPILFSGPMVRALLDGTKTQTRRIIKVQPPNEHYRISTLLSTTGDRRNEGRHFWGRYAAIGNGLLESTEGYFPNPYGEPGDRLWVRESWREQYQFDNRKPSEVRTDLLRFYEADNTRGVLPSIAGRYRNARFMPRALSRILLEVVRVRVERLQSITEPEACAEGVESQFYSTPKDHNHGPLDFPGFTSHRLPFERLWSDINGPESWSADPWVWVVEFKVISPAPTPTIQGGGKSHE